MKPAKPGSNQNRDKHLRNGRITFSSAVDVEVYKSFKAMCAERGTSIAKQIEALMRGEIGRHEARKARQTT